VADESEAGRAGSGARTPAHRRNGCDPLVPADRPDLDRADRDALTRREPDALARFYDLYFDRIYGYVRRLLRDEHLAEDTTQDIFMHLQRALATYDPARPLHPWVFKIATNKVRDVWQSRAYKEARRELDLDGDGLAPPAPETPTPLEELEDDERRRELAKAIETVPETLRATLVLRAYEGLSFQAIARLFGRTEVAIRKRYSRALHDLRETLSGSEPGAERGDGTAEPRPLEGRPLEGREERR